MNSHSIHRKPTAGLGVVKLYSSGIVGIDTPGPRREFVQAMKPLRSVKPQNNNLLFDTFNGR